MPFCTSISEIEKLTKEFRESIIKPDGRHVLKAEHTKFMRTVHFDFPHLDYKTIFELPKFLVRTTVFPRECRYHNVDQTQFFAWSAELCNYPKWFDKWKDKEFSHLFNLLVSSQLREYTILIPKTINENIHIIDFLTGLDIFATCFAFPLLERCIRYTCNEYVKVDGVVIKHFTISELDGEDIKYGNEGRKRVNNISHELKLLREYVASPEFRLRLDDFMRELNDASQWGFADPYNIIKKWRNPLLHGEQMSHIGLDFASYLISMLLLNQISEDEYNENLEDIRKLVKWKQRTSSPYLWYRHPID